MKNKTETAAKLSRWWDFFGHALGITTGVYGAGIGAKWGQPYGLIAEITLAIVVAYGFMKAIDGFRKFMGRSANENWLDRKTLPGHERRFIYLALLCYATFSILSATFTLWTGDELGKGLYVPPTPGAADSTAANMSGVMLQQDAILSKKERQAVAAVAQAKKDGHAGVMAAIKSGNPEFAKLWLSGNDWVKTEPKFRRVRREIAKAQQDSAKAVQEATALLSQFRASSLVATTSAIGIRDSIVSGVAAVEAAQLKDYLTSRKRFSNTVIWVDAAFLVAELSVFFLMLLLGGYVPRRRKEKTFSDVLGNAVYKIEQNILNWLATKVFRLPETSATPATPPNVSPVSFTETPAPKRPEPLFQTRPKGETGKKTKQEALEIMKEIESLRGGIRTQRSRLRKAERFLQKSGLSSEDVQAKQDSIKTYNAAIQRNEAKIQRLLEELNS